MSILGIDYGKKKIGLALSEGGLALHRSGTGLAVPYGVLRLPWEDAVRKITDIAKKEGIDRIVMGVCEQETQEGKRFTDELKKTLGIPIDLWDEALTTQEAQRLAIEAGIPRKKRKRMEDAFAAAIMLQSYLERIIR